MLPARLPEPDLHDADDLPSSIADAFVRQAARTPDRVAVLSQGRRFTYRDVDEQSSRLATYLRSLGAGRETLVGVLLPRSELLVVTLLGILKSGGAYVPLDPGYPGDRLQFVIEDSAMPIVVTSSELRSRLPGTLRGITVIDVNDPAVARQSTSAGAAGALRENLAYVIYTSGSTGKPKGVMVGHRNVLSFFSAMDGAIGCNIGVWLAVTSAAFDISVLELLWTLTRGFTVVLHDDAGESIADEIARHGVTHLQMTPSLARMLTLDAHACAAVGSLKQILLGGEAVPASLIARLREVFKGELYNMYGPTETTIWSTTYRIDEVAHSIPIGRPILNTQVYLLDSELKPVEPGEAGELFIGGEGVARGYWRRADLTAARFVRIPAVSADPVYRTGDLARTLSDGNLEFLGRMDHQIKLRGHRIEPGEIETLLEQCASVNQAVVMLREEKHGDAHLVAFITSSESAAPTAAALRSALAGKLPEVMVPSAFIVLRAMPVTQNGKIDRNALRQMTIAASSFQSGVLEGQPGNDMERIVADHLCNALGVQAMGLHDNFFDLGAHSLTIAEMRASLATALGRDISIVDLYEYPTVSSLSRHLAGHIAESSTSQVTARAQRRKLARNQ